MSTRKARLLAAERVAGAGRRGGVLTLQTGETAEDALVRAAAAGRTGPFIVMPPAMTAAEWEAAATAQQRELMTAAQAHMRDLDARHKRK